MRPGFISTRPRFFRAIQRTAMAATAFFLLLSAVIPAPLQDPANLEQVPNPVKAAWFLVWVQELVSYSVWWVYPVLTAGLGFAVLPYLPRPGVVTRAQWFPRDQWAVNLLVVAATVGVTALTVIALFFRGENWLFVSPF